MEERINERVSIIGISRYQWLMGVMIAFGIGIIIGVIITTILWFTIWYIN